jgi:hypothetical protein
MQVPLAAKLRPRRHARAGRRGPRRGLSAALAATFFGTILARLRGYSLGRNAIVRCRQGHLFTTIWIPGASIKAIRLGWWRFQRCPVGGHWTLVRPVRESELSERERRRARETRDVRVP